MLRYYEMIFIVHPNVAEEELPVVTDKVKGAIQQNKGEVIKLEKWGKRRCAHKIKKCAKGYYFLLVFRMAPDGLAELDRALRYDEKILRYQTVLLDKERIEALKKEMEDQAREEEQEHLPGGQESTHEEQKMSETH